MNKSKFAAVLVAIAGFVASAPALADQDGLFLGGMIGKSESKEGGCIDTNIFCDRRDNTWSGNAGYMFTRNWGAEAAYHNLGRVLDQDNQAGQSSTVRVRAISLVAIGSYSWDKFSIYLKAGAYRAKTDLTSSYLTEGSSKNNQWTYAVGLRYDIFKHMALRAEWQKFNNVGGGAAGFRADVDTFTGGVLLTF